MNKGQKNILSITLITTFLIICCSIRLYQIYNLPKIYLNGKETITMNLYESYNEQGAKAFKHDENISDEIKIDSNVNTNIPGNYKVSYKVEKKVIERNIIVKDNIKPTITINGAKNLVVGLNTEYIDEGATAIDNKDIDLTKDIKVSGSVDTTKLGTYEITYEVTDKAGNNTIEKRIIDVKESSSYIRVSIENQKIEVFNNNKLIIESDIVTGTENYHDTPKGVYQIYYKNINTYLKGVGYLSYVNYWMPFKGGYGLHDATWRNEFGGEIYKEDGSHGCVNLPLDIAKIIYENSTVGTYVEIY